MPIPYPKPGKAKDAKIGIINNLKIKKMTDKYILEGKEPKPIDDILEWGRFFKNKSRVVAQTDVGDVSISTVFLAMDHQFGDGPPLLFETMIFCGEHDGDQWRYSTWDEAEAGHKRAVELVKKSIQ